MLNLQNGSIDLLLNSLWNSPDRGGGEEAAGEDYLGRSHGFDGEGYPEGSGEHLD